VSRSITNRDRYQAPSFLCGHPYTCVADIDCPLLGIAFFEIRGSVHSPLARPFPTAIDPSDCAGDPREGPILSPVDLDDTSHISLFSRPPETWILQALFCPSFLTYLFSTSLTASEPPKETFPLPLVYCVGLLFSFLIHEPPRKTHEDYPPPPLPTFHFRFSYLFWFIGC